MIASRELELDFCCSHFPLCRLVRDLGKDVWAFRDDEHARSGAQAFNQRPHCRFRARVHLAGQRTDGLRGHAWRIEQQLAPPAGERQLLKLPLVHFHRRARHLFERGFKAGDALEAR